MIKLNIKNLLIISMILGIATLSLSIAWYYQITGDIKNAYLKNNNVTEFPAWYWIRLVLWPALIILITSGLFFLNNSRLVEIGALIVMLLGITGVILSFFTFTYKNVDQEMNSNNVSYIIMALSYVAGIISIGLIVGNLFTRQKEIDGTSGTKSKQILKEDIIDIQ